MIYYSLFTIYYLLFTIYYLLFTIYYIYYIPFTIYKISTHSISQFQQNHGCQVSKKKVQKKNSHLSCLTSFLGEWASSRSLCTDQSSIPSSIKPSSAQIHRRFGRHMISFPPCSTVRTSSKETTEPPKLGRP